jgi:hypothetical protein
MFLIKTLCVFCISVLIGFFICTAEKKTFYYYTNAEKQKTEIEKNEYLDIYSGKKINEGKDALNLSKENIYAYKNAVIYGLASFLLFMSLISLFEFFKRKNSTA